MGDSVFSWVKCRAVTAASAAEDDALWIGCILKLVPSAVSSSARLLLVNLVWNLPSS